MRYIMSELEEIEREDNFRLKRFKELKYKNKKGDQDTKKCYCKKQPEKGDDFVCFVCKQEEEKRRQAKKNPCEVTVVPGVEVIGDKASSLSTVNQKRLVDLNTQLEKVISLTCQCKLDGLVSQSVDRLIYACEEIRCKLETDQKQTTGEEQTPQPCCTSCENEATEEESEAPCETCKQPEETEDETEEDSLGYFETKYKETVKVMKFKNDDGTISEERQVVTIKTEKKHPHKPNEFGMSPCCKIKQITSVTSEESKSDGLHGNQPKGTKSEEIPCCMKEQTKARSCVSDSGSKEKKKKETKESSVLKCCQVHDAATDPEPPTVACCPKRCSSGNVSNKLNVSAKSSKKSNRSSEKEPSKKDASCVCKTEVKTICCDSMWKDVASSTTGLAESSEETEESCICIKDSETGEPDKKIDKVSIGQKSANSSIKVCCNKKSNETAKKKSSHTCSICSQGSQSMKDTSTTTSNIVLEENGITNKPSSIKVHSCISPPCPVKKSSSKIDKKPKPCCKDSKPDVKPKPCCKIRIISNQGDKEGNVQEFIFFGNILDAIKTILVPGKSDESIKTRDTKTSKNANTLSKKSSFKSSMCRTCESKVPSKAVERSRSCPQCNGKSIEKSISWSRPRSQSADSGKGTSKPCSCTPRADIVSKCSVCGSDLSKAMKSVATSADIDDDCVSCEIESCPLSRTAASSATNFNDDDEESCACQSSKKPPTKPTEAPKPKCKVCYPEEDPCNCQPKDQKQPPKEVQALGSKCKVYHPDKTQSVCCLKDDKSKQMEHPNCKVCYPEEDPCSCHPKEQNQESPKKTKASESKCKICNREKTQCECYPKDAKNKQVEPPKCKVCYPEEDPCSCRPKNQNQEPSTEVQTLGSKCKVCHPDKTQSKCCQDAKSKQMEPPKPKCKVCYPEEDPCSCHPKDQTQEPSNEVEALKSKCKVCYPDKTQSVCCQDAKSKQMEPPKPKCKVCCPEEDPCSCHPKDQNQESPKEVQASESKCKICHPDKTQSVCCLKEAKTKQIEPRKPQCKVCYPEEDPKQMEASEIKCKACHPDKNDTAEEKEPLKSKYKTCFSDENQNLSKSSQTGKKEKDSVSSSCPLCSEDQNSTAQNKKSTDSVPITRSGKSLCCDPSRISKDETDCKKCVGVDMKDASTSTRRSDRYDVRPLKLMKPVRKLTCTCHSDSFLTERSAPPPKRCSSCHADYFK